MGLHTADAIILRRYLYRETSVIVSCLTDRYGKIKGLVKGLRGQPNRHRSAMEPLTINRIVFYDTRSSQIHLISQCELMAGLPELQRELELARCAGFCVELTDAVVPLEEPQPATYQLLKQTLERLSIGAVDVTAERIHFIVRLLRLIGFQPQLDDCTGCGTQVHGAAFWSARQGGLLCPLCLHEDPKAEAITPALLQAIEALAETNETMPIESHLLPGLVHRLEEFLRWRLDHPLKTLEAGGWRLEAKTVPSSLEPRA